MIKLLEKEINDIKIYFFSIYDKKNRGSIKTDNEENIFLYDALLNTFYYLGIKIKEIEINDLIKRHGFNKSGNIYFEDFIQIIKDKLESFVSENEIKEYFDILSENKDYISKSDFDNIFEKNNDFENICQLISEIETEDSKIYYNDFHKIFE